MRETRSTLASSRHRRPRGRRRPADRPRARPLAAARCRRAGRRRTRSGRADAAAAARARRAAAPCASRSSTSPGARRSARSSCRSAPGVFVPRPETEQVAQLAIDALAVAAEPEPIGVDLGTGSGAIALALATEVPHARVWAVEKSPEAFVVDDAQRRARSAPRTRTLVFGDLAEALARARRHAWRSSSRTRRTSRPTPSRATPRCASTTRPRRSTAAPTGSMSCVACSPNGAAPAARRAARS